MGRADLRKIFSVEFPIIAPIVVKPPPGSPGYAGDLERVIAAAVKDAKLLDEGGVDGLSFENLGDAPFFKDVAPPESIASLGRVIGEVRRASSLPIGVNVLRNCASASLALSYVHGGRWIRVAAVQGLQDGSQGYQRGRRRLQRGFHLREAERFQRGGGVRMGQRKRLPEGLQAGATPENRQGQGGGARKRKTQETLVPSSKKISASPSLIDPDERIGPKLRDSPLFIGRPPTILLKGGITTSSPFPLLRVLYPALASSSRRSYSPKSQTDSLDLAPSPSLIS